MKSANFHFTQDMIFYTWRQLALRAGIEDFSQTDVQVQCCGVPLYYGFPDQIPSTGKKIVVIPCQERDWLELIHRPPGSIDWILPEAALPNGVTLPFDYSIPVIFWGNSTSRRKIAEYDGKGTLLFHVDILATVFFMLSRWEEINPPYNDEHGRFPASASVAYKQGFLDIPIVDLYGLLLREWLKVIIPNWNPPPLRLKINLTHDIDWIHHFTGPWHFARAAGVALLKQKKPGKFLRQFKNLYTQMTAPMQDEYIRSIYRLADHSEAYGFSSRFYIMAADADRYQAGYDPADPGLRQCLENLRQRGHEIGVHPGYSTLENPAQLITEKQRLEKALGQTIFGGRQHFLRFHVPSTWRHWEMAGLLYDSSMGYAQYAGFRCGTCHPYHPFDVEQGKEMKIQEIPLIVMDGSLLHYQKLSAQEGKNRILMLARQCAAVGGVFTMLWHNTSFSEDWLEWGLLYPEILNDLSKMANPYV
ncbi:MAG: polysaccharide deacetylase family protein [Anaerolineales bacterium]